MKVKKALFPILLISLLPGTVLAQAEGGAEAMLIAILSLMGFTVMVLAAVIFSLSSLMKAFKQDKIEKLRASGVEVVEEPGMLTRLYNQLAGLKPMEQESDILLDHDYDGIHELDNHLPPWWKYLFYFTIAFGVVYMVDRHVLHISPTQAEEYENAMAQAAEEAAIRQASMGEQATIDEANIEFTDDPAALGNGEKIYQRQCAACHRQDGGGSIGPNLTDEFWIHGGSMVDIYNTVKVGVPDKGMISWESTLSPVDMRDVSAYIMTLQGTNPANPKAPQGEKYEAPAQEEASVDAES